MRNKIFAFVSLIFFVFPSVSFAAIAFDSAVDGTTNSTFTFTNVAGNLVTVCVRGGLTDTGETVTYGGNAMTQVGKTSTPTDRWIYFFALVGAPTGSNSVAITGTVNRSEAASYSGVNTTGQPEVATTNTQLVAASITTTLTTLTNNAWLIGCGNSSNGVLSAGTNATFRVNSGTDFPILDTNAPQTPAGSHSMQINSTVGTDNFGMVMASFAPAANVVFATTRSWFFLFGDW